jgi:hypothetical protein
MEELYSLSYRDTDLWGEASLLRISGHSYREIVTPWNKVRFMNLTAVQLVKKFPLFFEPEGSVPCLGWRSIGTCFEALESSPHI